MDIGHNSLEEINFPKKSLILKDVQAAIYVRGLGKTKI
jgi:hypothetical protein